MDNKPRPGPGQPLSRRDAYVAGSRCFLLLGLLCCGASAYYHVKIPEWEARGDFVLWSILASFYEWGGTRGVVGFWLAVAGIFFAASLGQYLVLRTLPRDEEKGPEVSP